MMTPDHYTDWHVVLCKALQGMMSLCFSWITPIFFTWNMERKSGPLPTVAFFFGNHHVFHSDSAVPLLLFPLSSSLQGKRFLLNSTASVFHQVQFSCSFQWTTLVVRCWQWQITTFFNRRYIWYIFKRLDFFQPVMFPWLMSVSTPRTSYVQR